MRLVGELGLVATELGWVPSPTFVLRRAAILRRLARWAPGRTLEVGCGSGALLYELAELGFSGVGVETSPAARAVATQVLAAQPAVAVVESLPASSEPFDYLLAFEVLEHLEHDRPHLSQWVARLGSGGRCLLSVPAHSARWNVTDILAGHFRRYDRRELEALVTGAGLSIDRIETYGFPASWLIERTRFLVRWSELRARGIDPSTIAKGDAERTGRSGVERELESRLFPLYGSWPGRHCLRLAGKLQERFADTDWGISYLVTAHK